MAAAIKDLPPTYRPLPKISNEELANIISLSVRSAMQHLDDCAVSLLKLHEMAKKYGDEMPDFTTIPATYRELKTARDAIRLLRFKICSK